MIYFAKLLLIENLNGNGISIIIHLLDVILIDIIKNKNDKLFQNYLQLLKLITKAQKSSVAVLNSNEFFEKVVRSYFNTNNPSELIYAFEVSVKFVRRNKNFILKF